MIMEENRGKVIKEHVYRTHGQSRRGRILDESLGEEGQEGYMGENGDNRA